MWFCGSISVQWTNKHVDKSLFLFLFMFLFLVLSLSLFRISLSLIYLFVSSNSVVLSCSFVCLSVSSYFTLNWNWPSILPFFLYRFSFCCSLLSFLSHFTISGYISLSLSPLSPFHFLSFSLSQFVCLFLPTSCVLGCLQKVSIPKSQKKKKKNIRHESRLGFVSCLDCRL